MYLDSDNWLKASIEYENDMLLIDSGMAFPDEDMPGIDLSSNMIRQRASNNETIRFFVTESVRQYILEHNLYDKE